MGHSRITKTPPDFRGFFGELIYIYEALLSLKEKESDSQQVESWANM